MADVRQQELMDQLVAHGWRMLRYEHDLDWWADEMWCIESLWSPVGVLVYVTFLVDPESDHHERKTGEDVWAVMVSSARPKSRMEEQGEFSVSLGHGWKQRLPDFFDRLSQLRDS